MQKFSLIVTLLTTVASSAVLADDLNEQVMETTVAELEATGQIAGGGAPGIDAPEGPVSEEVTEMVADTGVNPEVEVADTDGKSYAVPELEISYTMAPAEATMAPEVSEPVAIDASARAEISMTEAPDFAEPVRRKKVALKR